MKVYAALHAKRFKFPQHLSQRVRLVKGICVGLMIALFVVVMNGVMMTAKAQPEMPQPETTLQGGTMKIKLTTETTEMTATLLDSATTRDFISLLPLTLTLEDYAGIEKISYLPRALSTQDAPAASEFTPGDLAYYAPWGNLAIHFDEFGYANGLIILGTIDGGKEALIVPGSMTVTIERLE
jgi:hypothetical protein